VSAGIGFEQGESARKGLGVFPHSPSLAIRQDAGLYLRWPDSCTVAGVKVSAGFKLHQGEEQGDKGGFRHKKSPRKAGLKGKREG